MYNSNNKHQENSQLTNHQSPITTQDIAIRVDNLSKIYRLYNSPKDRLKETLHPRRKKYHRDFYALKDVSFEVKKGETLGIIGKNGSGKSTLLKILTGVLTPSGGTVKVNGRVSALLELGSGFNPEFTGVENVYFQGSIMGFSREEMDKRLDDILSFADIGEFVHQPVRMYSSGMYVRLAFAVAIMVDPDILIVDEALAVGDARFQLKCMNRMNSIKESGKTIFLVTHSIDSIKSFSDIGIFLNEGKMQYMGDPKEATLRYFKMLFPNDKKNDFELSDTDMMATSCNVRNDNPDKNEDFVLNCKPEQKASGFGVGAAEINSICIYGLQNPNLFKGGEKISIEVLYSWNIKSVKNIIFENSIDDNVGLGIALANIKGEYIFGCNNFDADVLINSERGKCKARINFIMPYLPTGDYFLTLAVSVGSQQSHVQLKWYDYLIQLNCISCKKNVYGFIHLDYDFKVDC